MTARRRLLPRLLFMGFVLALFAAGGVLAWFRSWRTNRMTELAAQSEVVKLASGEMEFASRGSGAPVLVFHSAPGGYDQSIALAGFLEEEGFQIIAPSRPGYLRTPLATGLTPENQADAAAQLLDHLGLGKVSILGFGWGGPTAVEFARRFPDRTAALVLVSAVTAQMLPPPAPALQLPHAIADKLTGDVGAWAFVKKSERDPAAALSAGALPRRVCAELPLAWGDCSGAATGASPRPEARPCLGRALRGRGVGGRGDRGRVFDPLGLGHAAAPCVGRRRARLPALRGQDALHRRRP